MIALIIKSYLTILLSIAIGCFALFCAGIYFIYKSNVRKRNRPAEIVEPIVSPVLQTESNIKSIHRDVPDEITQSRESLSSIAGDDIVATQLDLSRAYIETGQLSAAKPLLQSVMQSGNDLQKKEAEHLLKQVADFEFVERVKKQSS